MTVVAEVVRSGFVESRHHGSLVVLDADGRRLAGVGDTDRPIFPRSCNKPLQATALVRLGLFDEFGLDERHLAIAAASHSGEPMHLELAADLLERAGRTAAALACPGGVPHNCSGKHAAMLAACVLRGWPAGTYCEPEHPLQRYVREVVEELACERVAAVGVDGCGAPLFALSLAGLARAFQRIDPRVTDAMQAHPELVGGTDRDVTRLMRAVPGLVAKDGAEAVLAARLPDGTAVTLKIEDGGARAATPVLVAALRALGVPGNEDELDRLAEPAVLGGGRTVGQVLAVPLAIASTPG